MLKTRTRNTKFESGGRKAGAVGKKINQTTVGLFILEKTGMTRETQRQRKSKNWREISHGTTVVWGYSSEP